jgi:hypothetical protein
MILAASDSSGDEEREVRVIAVDGEVAPGSRVS